MPPMTVLGALVSLVLVVASCTTSISQSGFTDMVLVGQFTPWGDPDAAASVERAFHARVEDLVAACMEDAGFAYVPVPLEAVSYGPGMGVTREEHARRFGFGISTVDEEFAAFVEATTGAADPNAEYVESLSPERAHDYSIRRAECVERARSQAPQYPDTFKQAVDDLVDRVRADPAVVEAEAEWSDCIRQADETVPAFSTPQSMWDWLGREYERVRDRPDELARLQDIERELALQHLRCEPALADAMGRVARQLEPALINDFRSVLDEQRTFIGK